jgi:hypothetical protein
MGIEFKVGAGGILTLVFAVAKLFGYFPFSWWIVFTPWICGYVAAIVLIAIAALLWTDE